MRVTPLRFTTLQCSQIGFTLVRTFTGAPVCSKEKKRETERIPKGRKKRKRNEKKVRGQTLTVIGTATSCKGTGFELKRPRTGRIRVARHAAERTRQSGHRCPK